MNKEQENYLQQIKSSFPIFRGNEKKFYDDFENSVREYGKKNPTCSQEELVEHFGNPNQVIEEYFDNINSNDYISLIKRKMYARVVAFVAVICLIFTTVAGIWYIGKAKQNFEESIVVSEETIIKYDNDN